MPARARERERERGSLKPKGRTDRKREGEIRERVKARGGRRHRPWYEEDSRRRATRSGKAREEGQTVTKEEEDEGGK